MQPTRPALSELSRAKPVVTARGRAYLSGFGRLTISVLAAIAVHGAIAAQAKYYPPEFFDLAGRADVVVLGDNVKVDDKSFTLSVREILAGSEAATKLEVVRFVDWTCSHRWKPYAVGQCEIAFLHRLDEREARETGARFGLLSAGDEGEWEVVGHEVSVQGFRVSGGRVDDQGEHPGQWLPLEAVLDALRHYRSCFSVRGDHRNQEIRQLCGARELEQYRRRSTIHEYLVQTSEEIAAGAAMRRPSGQSLPPEKRRE